MEDTSSAGHCDESSHKENELQEDWLIDIPLGRVHQIFPLYFLAVSVVTLGTVLQGKCTKTFAIPLLYVASFVPLFHYNGGMFAMNLLNYSLENILVYGNAVDLGQKCTTTLHKTIDALEAGDMLCKIRR